MKLLGQGGDHLACLIAGGFQPKPLLPLRGGVSEPFVQLIQPVRGVRELFLKRVRPANIQQAVPHGFERVADVVRRGLQRAHVLFNVPGHVLEAGGGGGVGVVKRLGVLA